jgi:CheY-like chemotaxis protein
VDPAESGLESIELVKRRRYDLVLMDHMMPGMDGIEAVAAIRKWEEEQRASEDPENPLKRLPIIALTANAVSGMKEMFLEKGFNDYISKPIEIAKLDEIIARWIPAEKRIKAAVGIKRESFSGESGLSVPGVDVKQGINRTGGTEAGYRKVLAQFYRDAAERLPFFAELPAAESLPLFAAQAHAIKSAAGTIGAAEVSAEAAALEAAGKAGDTLKIGEILPGFRGHLTELIEGMGKALEEKPEGKGGSKTGGGDIKAFSALQAALAAKNMKEIDRLLEELEAEADGETAKRITDISDKVLMGEYQKALEIINILLTAKEH